METDKRANDLAHQVFVQAQHALTEAANQGLRPSSEDPDDVHDYVRRAFEINAGLQAQLEAAISSPSVYEVSIADDDGLVLISNDESLPGKTSAAASTAFAVGAERFRASSKSVARALENLRIRLSLQYGRQTIWRSSRGVVVRFAAERDRAQPENFWNHRAAGPGDLPRCSPRLSAARRSRPCATFPRNSIAFPPGNTTRPPDSAGVFGGSGDELGQVSRKITQVGQQLRGVHEIFSTLRENMNSVMAGLEDGLLLFTRDARAVMVSPAAEKFLGASCGRISGPPRARRFFPKGIRCARCCIWKATSSAKSRRKPNWSTAGGFRRVGVSVQAIQEDGERMGALVTLRDLDSLESINTQLQVSERLAALGRITAGVAHEVKNPLNSMRLWLENLKESLPADQDSRRNAGGQRAGQGNRPARCGGKKLSGFHAADGYSAGSHAAFSFAAGSAGSRPTAVAES